MTVTHLWCHHVIDQAVWGARRRPARQLGQHHVALQGLTTATGPGRAFLSGGSNTSDNRDRLQMRV
jgi:hypothetical protein